MWMDVLNLIQSPQQAMDFKVSTEWDTGSFNSEICRFQQHKFTSMEKKITHTEPSEGVKINIERVNLHTSLSMKCSKG